MAGGTQRAAVPVGDSQLVSFSSTPSCCPPSHPHPRGRLVSYSLASVAPSTSCFAAEPRGRVSHLTRGSESVSRGESKVGRKRPPSPPPPPPPPHHRSGLFPPAYPLPLPSSIHSARGEQGKSRCSGRRWGLRGGAGPCSRLWTGPGAPAVTGRSRPGCREPASVAPLRLKPAGKDAAPRRAPSRFQLDF